MANPISDAISSVFGGAFSLSINVLAGIIVFAIFLLLFFKFFIYRRKFDLFTKIISERANDPKVYFDRGAILKDKDGDKFFRLLKTKVELPAPPFRIIESTNQGDYLELWRKSEDDFVFLTKPRIDRQKIVRADGRIYNVGQMKQRQLEGDYYYIAKRRAENKRLLHPESFLMKLLEYAPQIISLTITFILLWIVLDKAPAIINKVVELTTELRNVAAELGTIKGATTTSSMALLWKALR